VIASWRGIAVLAAVAIALAALLAVDLTRTHAPVDRRLVHVDVSKVQRLAWGDLVAKRSGTTWKAGADVLDSAAIEDVLRTLEAATWHRRRGTPGTIHATLDVDKTHIGIADPLPGAEQTWLVVDGTPLLVDTWVAHALVPGALALHVRHPFAGAVSSDQITVGQTQLRGHPRTLPDGRIADVAAVATLERALAEVEVVALGDAHGGGTLTPVLVANVVASVGGSCDASGSTVAVWGTIGSECIPKAAWERVVDAARAATTVDPRPVLSVPRRIQFLSGDDGTALFAHDAATAPLVHAVVTPGTPIGPIQPGTKQLATLNVDAAVIDVLPDDRVLRRLDGETIRIAHDDWLALQRPPSAFADPTRWSEDPSAVTEVAVDKTTYRRGSVLGEWTPTAPLSNAQLETLAAALAHVQAREGAAAPTAHTLTVTLAPPVGPQATHTLEVGTHCAGRIDGKPVTYEPSTCNALAAVAH
jgi:hypothetical protein